MSESPSRAVWPALRRGFAGRCPACGEGRQFRAYLKVAEACPACGETLSHQRADDLPAYLTIFVVGHVVVGALLAVEQTFDDVPVALHMAIWPALTVVLSLALLPAFKGATVALQWALRMHGFGGPAAAAAEERWTRP
jgi:uncharacterized protein (DUF983 family)